MMSTCTRAVREAPTPGSTVHSRAENEMKSRVEHKVLPTCADRLAEASPKFLPRIVTVVAEAVLPTFGLRAVTTGTSYEKIVSLFDA